MSGLQWVLVVVSWLASLLISGATLVLAVLGLEKLIIPELGHLVREVSR